MKISKLARSVSASATIALDTKAKKLKSEGVDVISFGVGEPDFDTPRHIKDEAIEAIRSGFTKYTQSSGIPALRQAICDKFLSDSGLRYTPAEVLVSVGAKHSIYNAVLALCDPGDQVLIPAPYWVSYPEMVKLAGGIPVPVQTGFESWYKVTPPMLLGAITPQTSLFIMNSPSNPSGMVYTEEEIRALAMICVERGIAIISDEIYEKLVYEGKHVSVAALSKEIAAITVTVNGVSKSHAMTGWRIGYAAGPKDVVQAMGNIQSHSTSNAASISQRAALAAIVGTEEPLERMRDEFRKRRDYTIRRIREMPYVRCHEPHGAFYVYPDVSQIMGRKVCGETVATDAELADVLLEKARIAVVPGQAFGTLATYGFPTPFPWNQS